MNHNYKIQISQIIMLQSSDCLLDHEIPTYMGKCPESHLATGGCFLNYHYIKVVSKHFELLLSSGFKLALSYLLFTV